MLVIPGKRKLVVSTPRYAELLAAIPHAKVFQHNGEVLTAVEHGVDEALVLRNLGYKNVPSPILHYYDWPARFTPMDHQRETAAFLVGAHKGLCLNAPGTGKSISALWAADYLMRIGKIRKVLIIAPLSTLKPVWGMELMHHMPHRKFQILSGSRTKRLQQLDDPALEVAIINHDGFSTMPEMFMGYDLVIYDEATALKSPGSQRFKKFVNFMTKNNPWLWLLTGTPIAQNPTDAWALAKLVNSKHLPRSFTAFKDMTMRQVTSFKWVPRDEALEVCKRVLQPSIRFDLSQCKDLPETVFIDRECDLTPPQAAAFKEMRDEACILGAGISAANAAVLFQKMLQIACIAHDTPVLTARGWVPIQNVTAADQVWDGHEWVSQGGAIYRGSRSTVSVCGVHMTADHKVWVGEWTEARELIHDKTCEEFSRAAVRIPDGYASCGDYNRSEPTRDVGGPGRPVPVDDCAGAKPVYDLINCGPRSRFVVSGATGTPIIVHNCGVAYSDDKERVVFDDTDRVDALKEILDEIGDKCIVFVPLRGVQDRLEKLLQDAKIDVAAVHGDVSKKDRDDIFHRFQNTEEVQVLLAHPKVAAHGLTLTRASNIVWYAPIYSLEMYEQANARIKRLTTEGKTVVYHIYATAFEQEMYRRLKHKQKVLSDFLSLVSGRNE